MRRKPYAQMPGVSLSVDPARLYGRGAVSPGEPSRDGASGDGVSGEGASPGAPATSVSAGRAPMEPAEALLYRAEIRNLAAIVERHREKTDSDGLQACAFVSDKLAEATRSLDGGDGEKSWLHLYGAAKLCLSFGIEPAAVNGALAKINGLL